MADVDVAQAREIRRHVERRLVQDNHPPRVAGEEPEEIPQLEDDVLPRALARGSGRTRQTADVIGRHQHEGDLGCRGMMLEFLEDGAAARRLVREDDGLSQLQDVLHVVLELAHDRVASVDDEDLRRLFRQSEQLLDDAEHRLARCRLGEISNGRIAREPFLDRGLDRCRQRQDAHVRMPGADCPRQRNPGLVPRVRLFAGKDPLIRRTSMTTRSSSPASAAASALLTESARVTLNAVSSR